MTAGIAVLVGLLISLAAQLVKNKITPKYGANGVHIFIGALAVLVTGVQIWSQHNANVMVLLEQAGLMLTAVVGTYHVIFEKIGNATNIPGMID